MIGKAASSGFQTIPQLRKNRTELKGSLEEGEDRSQRRSMNRWKDAADYDEDSADGHNSQDNRDQRMDA